ncbi:MAG: hypothetical protein R3B45_10930 [Bdellovibrionota bacterium]
MTNEYRVSYIRDLIISKMGEDINVLASRDGHPTWVEQGNIMLTIFHPELNGKAPPPWHRRFVGLCKHIIA